MEKGQKSHFALFALVIGMGVAILILFGVVVVTLVNRSGESEGLVFEPVSLPIPPGCDIAAATPDGEGRLILRLAGGEACRQVLLVRIEDGSLLGVLQAE